MDTKLAKMNHENACLKSKETKHIPCNQNVSFWTHSRQFQVFFFFLVDFRIRYGKSSNFIYVVFSVSAMCYKMSLHGIHGCAAKSPCKNPATTSKWHTKTFSSNLIFCLQIVLLIQQTFSYTHKKKNSRPKMYNKLQNNQKSYVR